MKKKVDINVDIGEGFPFDEELLDFATSANVCCGAHAGSLELTEQTIELCLVKGVRIGCHPGYPDRESMGRQRLDAGNVRQYLDSVFKQVNDFVRIGKPEYLKPHGAFYNDTAIVMREGWDRITAEFPDDEKYTVTGKLLNRYPGLGALRMLLRMHDLPLMGLAGTTHEIMAERAEMPLIKEGFADRKYLPDGTLMPRSQPGAVLTDPAAVRAQVIRLAARVDSICIHGDTPDCVAFAQLVRKTLVENGYEVSA